MFAGTLFIYLSLIAKILENKHRKEKNLVFVQLVFLVMISSFQPALHPHLFLMGWLKLNIILSLDQLRLTYGDECC